MERRKNTRVRVNTIDTPTIGISPQQLRSPTGASKSARNASALSAALGFASDVVFDRDERKQNSDIAAGTLAAEQGEITPENLRTMEKSAAFVFGAESVLGRTRAIEDEQQLKEWYSTTFDKNKDLSTLRVELNDQMRSLYEGADAGIAREAAPFLSRAGETIMAAHGQRQTEEGQALVAEGLTTNMGEFLSRSPDERTKGEWDLLRSKYTALFDKEEGVARLAADVSLAAVNARDERILEEPMFEKLATNPATRDGIARAKSQARTLRLQDRMAEESLERAVAFEGGRQLAESKDPNFFMVLEANTTPDAEGVSVYTEGEAQRLLALFYNKTSTDALTQPMVDQFADGLAGTQGDPKWYEASAQGAIQQYSATHTPEDTREWAIDRTVSNGQLPDFLKRQMANADPTNQTTWPTAIAWYNDFQNQRQGFLERQLPEETVRTFEAYNRLAADFGPQEAVRRLESFDSSLVSKVTRDERSDALADVYDVVTDIPWSFREVNEIPRLRKAMDATFDFYIGVGYGPDRAARFAIEQIGQTTQVIDGTLYPANSAWGPTGNDAADFAKATFAERVGIDADEIEISPVPGRPGQVTVGPLNSLPGIGETFKIEDLVRNHNIELRRQSIETANEAREGLRDKFSRRAMRRAFPDAPFRNQDFATFVAQSQQNKWAELSPEEQNVLIDQIALEEKQFIKAKGEAQAAIADNPLAF